MPRMYKDTRQPLCGLNSKVLCGIEMSLSVFLGKKTKTRITLQSTYMNAVLFHVMVYKLMLKNFMGRHQMAQHKRPGSSGKGLGGL